MSNGRASSSARARSAPHRARPVALSVLAVLLLSGFGVIVAGLVERPAGPSWVTGETRTEPSPAVTATSSSGTPTRTAPDPSPTAPATRPSAPAQQTVAARKPRKKKKPSRTPYPAAPTSSPTPSAVPTSSPPVVTLGARCAPEGARTVSRLGFAVICGRRPWDDTLRWRLT